MTPIAGTAAATSTHCTTCSKPQPAYRCTTCPARYCSVGCFRAHKATHAPAASTAVDATSTSGSTSIQPATASLIDAGANASTSQPLPSEPQSEPLQPRSQPQPPQPPQSQSQSQPQLQPQPQPQLEAPAQAQAQARPPPDPAALASSLLTHAGFHALLAQHPTLKSTLSTLYQTTQQPERRRHGGPARGSSGRDAAVRMLGRTSAEDDGVAAFVRLVGDVAERGAGS